MTKNFENFLSNFLRGIHKANSGQFRKNLINFFPSLSFGDGSAVLTKAFEKISSDLPLERNFDFERIKMNFRSKMSKKISRSTIGTPTLYG